MAVVAILAKVIGRAVTGVACCTAFITRVRVGGNIPIFSVFMAGNTYTRIVKVWSFISVAGTAFVIFCVRIVNNKPIVDVFVAVCAETGEM